VAHKTGRANLSDGMDMDRVVASLQATREIALESRGRGEQSEAEDSKAEGDAADAREGRRKLDLAGLHGQDCGNPSDRSRRQVTGASYREDRELAAGFDPCGDSARARRPDRREALPQREGPSPCSEWKR
jgi:hypothetical protein